MLIYDLSAVIAAINEWVFTPLTQNQFDALVAFAFNIGLPNFRRSSVLRRLNEGSHLQAACAMEMWRTADFEGERIVIDALVRRRSAEMALYLTPLDGPVPVPSLIVLPRVDDAVARNAPSQSVEVEAPLESPVSRNLSHRRADAFCRPGGGGGGVGPAQHPVAGHPPRTLGGPATAGGRGGSGAGAGEYSRRGVRAAIVSRGRRAASGPVFIGFARRPSVGRGDRPVHLHEAYHDDPVVAQASAPEDAEPDTAANEDDDFAPRPIAFSLPPRGVSSQYADGPVIKKTARTRTPEPVLALLGVIGLVVFTTGILWAFNAKAAPRFANLPDPLMAGWAMGLAGVALAASSVYLLLRRMGAKGD